MASSLSFILALLLAIAATDAVTVHLLNKCPYTVWPGAVPVGGGSRLDPGQLPRDQLRRGHQRKMPARAEGGRRLLECLPQVRHPTVLLHTAAYAVDLRADGLLALLQGALPGRLQLRLRRQEQHIYLPGRIRLPTHLLPIEAIGIQFTSSMDKSVSVMYGG
ncbi:unnamed protein product [Triticum turgidum subsp. durum]|uniref:Uncharacterized protein n=1 Tax=Triticum turgidum subsp. durum TaxID=4567 RepID=A0A9R0WJ88_TRITD|nr:unnamed protein product [Triticum turgidum subsp. durum]